MSVCSECFAFRVGECRILSKMPKEGKECSFFKTNEQHLRDTKESKNKVRALILSGWQASEPGMQEYLEKMVL